jgi:putative flippase GtrA
MNGPTPRRRVDVALVQQFIKYGLVGVSNTAITYAVYAVAVLGLGLAYELSVVIGWLVGGLNSYLLNRHWTFRAGDLAHSRLGKRFAVVQAGAIAANVGLLYVLVHSGHMDKLVGQAIVQVPIVLITFFINRSWTFHRPISEPLASPSAPR